MGRWLIDHGVSLVFTGPCAISAIVVSFPLVYRTALGAAGGPDRGRCSMPPVRWAGPSGASPFRLCCPWAGLPIAAGTVLAFARAMGEFGCTLFFAGNYAGITQTIPIAIYFEWMGGDTDVALFWVLVVIAFSFLVILFINLYTARSQAYRSRGYIMGHAVGDAYTWALGCRAFKMRRFWTMTRPRAATRCASTAMPWRELMRTDAAVGAAAGAPRARFRRDVVLVPIIRNARRQGRPLMSLVLDIKKAYPDFSLDVRLEAAGERVALLGASGCGKSCTPAQNRRRGDARRRPNSGKRRDVL